MELTVHGKQMDVGDALRTHVSDKLTDLNEKYFNHAAFATVTFSREGHGHKQTKVHILIQVGKNIQVIGDAVSNDPYASFENAADKVGKQMRRYKRKLRDHHARIEQAPDSDIVSAKLYTLQDTVEQDNEDTSEDSNQDPIVIAELTSNIVTMSVSEAVMRMDLAGSNALMFRNAGNGRLNMIHRRKDGHIGWVDPDGDK